MSRQDVDEAQLGARLAGLAKQAHESLTAGCRTIRSGDENALGRSEQMAVRDTAAGVRRASGAARIVARALLRDLGLPEVEIPRTASGAPRWPEGVVGSLAHDDAVAVAAVARTQDLRSVGIDVEPRQPLPPEILDLVATPAEREQLAGDLLLARHLFCMKEAVYKATNPLDGKFLDHHDVEVCLGTLTARTTSGHILRIHAADHPRLLALTVVMA